jgi:tRNA (Thr-GGU) A37 N-methylase
MRGVFALRSPRRPNPIGVTIVELLSIENNMLRVRGLDAINGTPVLDLKPA